MENSFSGGEGKKRSPKFVSCEFSKIGDHPLLRFCREHRFHNRHGIFFSQHALLALKYFRVILHTACRACINIGLVGLEKWEEDIRGRRFSAWCAATWVGGGRGGGDKIITHVVPSEGTFYQNGEWRNGITMGGGAMDAFLAYDV
jgi:hypothetical protein